MKYLILLFLLTSCAGLSLPDRRGYNNTKERIMTCVDRYVDRDVEMKKAYEVCKEIYKRT